MKSLSPLYLLLLAATLVAYPWLKTRDISDTNRICKCFGSAPWGTESDRTFNERTTLETRIDVTLDYLNGTDFPIQWLPNVSPTRTPKMCMHGRGRLLTDVCHCKQ